MIELQKISLSQGSSLLLDQASAVINPGEKVGLVGRNGAGKSTLFQLIRKELEEEAGQWTMPGHWRISSVLQEVPQSMQTALDYVLEGDDRYTEIQNSLFEAEKKEDFEAIIDLHEKMHAIDGYTAVARAAELLYGLSFSAEQQKKAIKEFSGGWQMRLNLARALMKPCDLLLLDEPTNHLDMDTIYWLEKWLAKFEGTLIVIAHDSVFLDNVVNKVLSIENKSIISHRGNYSAFLTWRAQQLALEQKFFEKQQKHIAHLQSFISRFKAKASKAKQAQSRMKALARIELVATVHVDSAFEFSLESDTNCPNPVISLDRVQLGYENNTVLKNIHKHIAPGDRIGLLGLNGAGKSTLIKAIAGELQPLSGEIIQSPQLKIGYFSQHQVDTLHMDESAFWHMKQLKKNSDQKEIRSYLGQFGFQGDKVFDPVSVFSGGEKSRLVLALLSIQKPHLLLLDEPTNHLDLEMREALSLALQHFEGAVLIVSHDRQLLNSVADQFWIISDQTVLPYDGDLQEYTQWLSQERLKKTQTINPNEPDKKKLKDDSNKNNYVEIQKIEKMIAKLAERLKDLNSNLLSVSYNDPRYKRLLEEKTSCELELKYHENQWIDLQIE